MTSRNNPERKKEFKTTVDGIVVKTAYTPEDVKNSTEKPGEYPFTRSITSSGYRSRLWTMRQYAGFGTVDETNKRYKYLFQQGQTGFSVAFHLPTQQGYDSDHPLSLGEVGQCGVAIDSLQDMERLWDGIPLQDVSTSMTINATAPIILAMYFVAAEKQGVPMDKLNGTVQNDILKEYVARNTYFLSPAPSMRLVTDLCSFCAEKTPKWNSISISGYHMREAGCTAVQEIGFTLANAIAYVEAMIARGMEVDSFAPQFSFFFGANNNVIEEVAKFRAARRLWAKIMKERFGARNPRSMTLRFHAQTDGFTLSAQQPLNNVVRVTLQAFAAVLGGAQSLHTNSYNEALCLPTEEAVQLALRTQQIIAHESGATDTIDPLGGSYFMESLTDQIEAGAAEYIATIDNMGGALKAIESGYIQREIAEVAYKYQKAVENSEQIVVGVNQYSGDSNPPQEVFTINPETEATQKSRLAELKSKRDNSKVVKALANVKKAAAGNANIMPVLIDAVRAYATVGEISDALRSVFGEYTAPNVL